MTLSPLCNMLVSSCWRVNHYFIYKQSFFSDRDRHGDLRHASCLRVLLSSLADEQVTIPEEVPARFVTFAAFRLCRTHCVRQAAACSLYYSEQTRSSPSYVTFGCRDGEMYRYMEVSIFWYWRIACIIYCSVPTTEGSDN
jgi:hypothetical protein